MSYLIYNNQIVQSNGQYATTIVGDKILDYDGNEYTSVIIDGVEWLAQDLKVTTYNDGTPIPNITNNASWQGDTSGAYCWYDNNISNKTTYGALYNSYAIGHGDLEIEGWHVATQPEWLALSTYLVTNVGGKLKEAGLTHWTTPNTGANNETGFTAVPGGYRYFDGTFLDIGDKGKYWTDTVGMDRLHMRLEYDSATLFNPGAETPTYGMSVRLVKD